MRIVIALGGNALLTRGEKLTAENQRRNIKLAVKSIVPLIDDGHDIVITHGSGPQIGLLALQGYAYRPDELYPLDVLDAEVEGMIGYMIGQELYNARSANSEIVSVLTQIEVNANDPAFNHPTKPIGPRFEKRDAEGLAKRHGWTIVKDRGKYRRAVPSPHPVRLVEANVIKMLVERGVIVICAGGGGIPVTRDKNGDLTGVEAVIDKDHASALLGNSLKADLLVLLTDVDGVYENWGEESQRLTRTADPKDVNPEKYPAGSMGPKVAAACVFAETAGRKSAIGSIASLSEILDGRAGTHFERRSSD